MIIRRIFLIGILWCGVRGQGSGWVNVPNCPSLRALNNGEVSPDPETGTFPSCYCDNATADTSAETGGIEISCILFGQLSNMAQAIYDVHADNRTVWNIHTNGFIFENSFAIPANFFTNNAVKPRRLSFHGCSPSDENDISLEFHPEAFAGLEESLEHWDMRDCPLKRIPENLHRLKALKVVDFRSTLANTALSSDAFKGLENLKSLDLSENRIEEWGEGTFRTLTGLEELILGPRNKFSDSLLPEINALPSLKSLKLDTMGIENLTGTTFQNMSKLETLSLVSNDLKTIPKDAFTGLSALKSLDLRINLIHTIEPGAFEPLGNLRELHVAGTYFQGLEPNHFRGMDKLEDLDLSFCEILAIPNDTFLGLDSLKKLSLRGNARLATVFGGAFNGLGNLESLNMSDTAVSAISERVFAPLTNLTALSLSRTAVRFVNKFAFAENEALEELYLDDAFLTWLPDTVFAPLQSLKVINISGNPWICDERIKNLRNNIKATLVQRIAEGRPVEILSPSNLLCADPAPLRGQPVMLVPDRSLRPFDPDLYTDPPTTPSTSPPPTTPPPSTPEPTIPPSTKPTPAPATQPPPQPPKTNPPGSGIKPGSKFLDESAEEEPEPAAEGGLSRTTLGIAVAVIILAIIVIAAIIVGVVIMRKKKRTRGITDTAMSFKRGKGSGEEDVVRNGRSKSRPQPDGVSNEASTEEGNHNERESNGATTNGHSEKINER